MNHFALRIYSSLESRRDNEPPVLQGSDGVGQQRVPLGPCADLYVPTGSYDDLHFSTHDGKTALVLVGYITEAPGIADTSDQDALCKRLHLLLESARREGTLAATVRELNGSFAFILLGLEDGHVQIVVDRFASRPLWRAHDEHGLWVSSEAMPIARGISTAEYRLGGLASYLLYATAVDPTQCMFPGVKSQPEGSMVEIDRNGREEASHWFVFRHTPDLERSEADWLRLIEEVLLRATQRVLATTRDPVVLLSGGLDSRLTAALLCAAGGNPLLFTLADSENLEIRTAAKVGKVLGCQHEFHYRSDDHYLRALRRAMAYANGTHWWGHAHYAEVLSELRAKREVDGVFVGDFLEGIAKVCCSASPERTEVWTQEEFVREFDTLSVPAIYRPIDRTRTLSLLRPDVRAKAESELEEDIAGRYASIRDVSTEPDFFGDYVVRRQCAACHPVYMSHMDLRSAGPERNIMFDREAHDLFTILPSAVRARGRLGARLISRLKPRLGLVRNANTLLPLRAPRAAHRLATWARPKLGKVRRLLFSDTYKTTDSWPHLPMLMQRNEKWRSHIAELLLDGDGLPSHVFDQAAIEASLKEFNAGELRHHYDIERLMGLVWMRRLMS